MSEKLNNILNLSECPSSKTLMDYSKGLLSEAEAHAVEKHLIDCEMCSDELEGISLFHNHAEFDDAVNQINLGIDNSIKKEEKKIIPLFNNSWLKYAAIIVIFVGLGFLVNKFASYNDKNAMQVAENETPKAKTKEDNQIGGTTTKENDTEYRGADDKKEEKEETKLKRVESIPLKEKERDEIAGKAVTGDSKKESKTVYFEVDKDDNEISGIEEVYEEMAFSEDMYKVEDSEKELNQPIEAITNEQSPSNEETISSKKQKDGFKNDQKENVVGGIENNRASKAQEVGIIELADESELRINDRRSNKRSNLFNKRKGAAPKSSLEKLETQSPAEQADATIEGAKELYEQTKYSEVLDIYYYIPNGKKTSTDNLYIGLSLYRLNKFEESLSYFDFVIKNIDEKKYEAIFYKALVLKNLHRDEEAKTLFNYLISNKNPFSEKSSKILQNWQTNSQ